MNNINSYTTELIADPIENTLMQLYDLHFTCMYMYMELLIIMNYARLENF